MVSVVFDVDGTLFEKDHILEVYRALGLKEEAKEIHKRYGRGEIDHRQLWEEGTDLLKGVSRERLKEVSADLSPRPDAEECINRLCEKGYDVYALTDGFVDLIEEKLPCRVYGKSIRYKEGCVDSLGEDPVTSSLLERDGKSKLLETSYEEVVVVDDHPENISGAFEVLDPNDFRDLNAIADFIIITRETKPKGGGKMKTGS